ncbi:hypothetical protein, partial [Acinetobacter baumannii]|uniref:hypothetical protein n=1 Tax=Acinetobacter baumannii TaxID=470 RepID=UPI000E1783CA
RLLIFLASIGSFTKATFINELCHKFAWKIKYVSILTNSTKYQNKKNSAKKIIFSLSLCIN